MKKIFLLLTATLFLNSASGQTGNYQKAFSDFEKAYNAGNFDKIFSSFSPEMKKALPPEKTNEFLNRLKAQAGNIESKEFIGMRQRTYAHYKTRFQKAILSVNISLDSLQKINGLFVKPFKEPDHSPVVNALINLPGDLPEILYDQVKVFPNHTQLSIAIIKNGTIKFYGLIKENDSLKTIENKDKVFEIGSITKVFTSTVLASLIMDKKLSLEDNINQYYPFPFRNNIQITFKSLANHTSGLPRLPSNFDLSDQTNPYKNYGVKELYEYLKNEIELKSRPNETYSYSNLGGGLLGYTLGLSQKTTFQKLLQQRVFEKYKMSASYVSSHDLNGKLVKGLDEKGHVVPNWDFDVLFGGGGILSSVNDLSKFALAQFSPANKELALTRIPTFTVNDKMKISLGWHILKTKEVNDLYWHNGGTGGYSSSMALDIENKNGVIILSNVSAFNPDMKRIDNLCFELISNMNNE